MLESHSMDLSRNGSTSDWIQSSIFLAMDGGMRCRDTCPSATARPWPGSCLSIGIVCKRYLVGNNEYFECRTGCRIRPPEVRPVLEESRASEMRSREPCRAAP